MNLVENAVLFDKYRVGDVFDQNSVFTTYLGTQINGGAPVYIKLLDQARYTQYDVDKICFNNELPAIKSFDHRHILRTLDAGPISNTICMITEFADFIPLDRFLENRRVLDLPLAIDFIVQLAEALKYAHEHNIIHRSIKAGTIGVCTDYEESGKADKYELKIFDFGLSYITDFSDIPSNQVDAEFGFMAPEVAGLLNRKVDARSDLYSLGVLFYRFVTGSYPFHTGTIDSMVYQHVAIVPRNPSKLNSSVPEEISRIILKLLAKDPDQRYQSAESLIYDLDLFKSSSASDTSFAYDLLSDLEKNSRVFSCKYELANLRQSYSIAFEGEGRFCLVSGAKGCGKSDLLTALANELKASDVACYRAHFTVQTTGTPYHGFHEILRLFVEDYNKTLRFLKGADRNRLPQDVVRHSDLATNIFPEAKDIFADYVRAGEAGESAELESYKELQRSLSTLAEFFLSLTVNRPYVLIFDDIHYIDDASLTLLREMLSGIGSHKVFIVCSCRSEELPGNSALSDFISLFSTDRQPILIRLQPFDRDRMREYLCDLLIVSPNQCDDLLDYIMEITEGNPYFAANVLHSLLEDNIISVRSGTLDVDIKLLRNVIDKNEDIFKIISRRIDRLTDRGIEALKQAAVIGDSFSFDLLEKVTDYDHETLSQVIDRAIDLQLIDCSSTAKIYEFAHRDIHTAFISLISDPELKEIHLKIARSLEALESGAAKDIYRLVYHYTEAGADDDVYRYIMEAAALAKYSYATNEALSYYTQALKLINKHEEEGSENWCIAMDSLIDLNLAAGDGAHAIELANSLLPYIPDQFTTAKLFMRIGIAYYRLSDFEKCENFYIKALVSLGRSFKPEIISNRFLNRLYGISVNADRTTKTPEKKKPKENADVKTGHLVASLYELLCWSYAFSDIRMFSGTILRMYRYVLKNLGVSADFGLTLCGMSLYYTLRNNGKSADECQMLGLQYSYESGDTLALAKSNLLTGIKYQWRGDVYKSLKSLKEAADGFAGVGDLWQFNNANVYLSHSYQMAGEYSNALKLCNECEAASIRLNDTFSLALTYAYMLACYTEMGDYSEANATASKCEAVVNKLQLPYLQVAYNYESGRLKLEEGKYSEAIAHFEEAKRHLDAGKVVDRYRTPILSYLAIAMIKKLDRDRNDLTVTEIQNQEFAIAEICDRAVPKNKNKPSNSVIASRAQALLGILTGRFKTTEKAYRNGNTLTTTNQYHYENAMLNFEYSQYLISKHKLIGARFFIFEAYMLFSHISSHVHMKECEKIISERYQEAFNTSPLLMSVMERHNKMNSDRRINTLLRLGAVLTSTLNDVDLQRQILQEAVELVGAERGILFLYPDSGEKKLYVASVYNLGSFDSNTYDWMLEEVERSKKPIVINDVQSDEFRKHYPVMARYGIKSVMAMPMLLRGDLYGVIYLDSRLVRQIFSDEYIEAVDFIAKQGGSPIQNARLYQRAITDGLTGIFGRSYLNNKVADLTAKEDSKLAAIMIDVDNFKRCNDTYGHPFGDKVLRNIAGIMKRVVGDAGLVCRYGGEEFVVLLYSDNEIVATSIAEKIRQTVERSAVVYTNTESVNITISLGVSLWDHSMERIDLIEHADKALYYAKKHGKNQYILWREDLEN